MENLSLEFSNILGKLRQYLKFIYLALPTRTGSPQQHVPITVGSFTSPTLSTFPVGGNQSTWRKPMTFDRVLTFTLHMRTGFESH